jgi:hypothetical protein
VNEREIFMTALDQESPDARNRYLDEACGDDRELRRRVDALLQSYTDSGSFLERPVLADEKTLDLTPATDPAGPQPPADDPPDLPDPSSGPISLDFLQPSDASNSLGRLGQYDVREVVGRGAWVWSSRPMTQSSTASWLSRSWHPSLPPTPPPAGGLCVKPGLPPPSVTTMW